VNAFAGDDAASRGYAPKVWERLVELKTAWDPDNVFRLNANVPPRAALAAAVAI
jgi:Berberine and berberine like